MAKHRGYTFRPGTISRFAKMNGLKLAAIEVSPEMVCMKQEHPGERFFLLNIRNSSGNILRIPYMQGYGVRGEPELNPTLEKLASDARLYFEYGTAEQYCEAFSIPEWECEKAFEVLEHLVGRTREFLGEKAFGDLLGMPFEGFEMEGDRGWRNKQTCGG